MTTAAANTYLRKIKAGVAYSPVGTATTVGEAEQCREALAATPVAVTDAMIDAALYARVPGGSQAWAWLPQEDAWTPHQTARDVMRSALEAVALAAPVPVAVTDAMVHAYKHSFGEYMNKVEFGRFAPPTPDIGFHATKYALGVALSPAQAVPVGYLFEIITDYQADNEKLLEALTAIYQRGNEIGTGEMGLIDTIHDMCGIARKFLVKAKVL
ncbi:MAG: hypothetical protein EOS07_22025 [Mesorhizobium sp.]|nr:MAG: hypothetical protein EOS07_22025 [Mesorhizobium sp.]